MARTDVMCRVQITYDGCGDRWTGDGWVTGSLRDKIDLWDCNNHGSLPTTSSLRLKVLQ